MLSSHLTLCHPLLLLSSVFSSIRVFLNESALHIRWPKYQSFLWIFRVDFLLNWLVWSPCSLRDCQEYSPAPQFESINSLVLSLLYGPILTFVHDYWKNHSFNYTDLFWQSDLLLSNTLSRFHSFSSKEQVSFTVYSDLEAQGKSVTVSIFPSPICHEEIGQDTMILAFECWVLGQPFHSPLSPSSRGFLVPLCFLPLEWYHLHIWDNFIFLL